MAIKKSVKRRVQKNARKTGKRAKSSKRMVKGGNTLTGGEIDDIINKVIDQYPHENMSGAEIAKEKARIRGSIEKLSMANAYNYEFKNPESDVVRDKQGKLISRGQDTLIARAEDLAIGMWGKGY